jgi:hypothetical protein
MEIVGYIVSILIGVSLGLIGGGGSILTVPVLVYLFNVNPSIATSYSLFVVGTTSLIGAWTNYRRKQVSVQTALIFGVTSIATVLLTRKFIVPAIPAHLFTIGSFVVTKAVATMLLFAILMILASISMIKPSKKPVQEIDSTQKPAYAKLMVYGLLIGLITGLLGAGGGFLLIPALILLVKLPMKTAVGTSLFIIALNSLIGFMGDLDNYEINWKLLLSITALAVIGIIIGTALGKKIEGAKLKKGFGWFVLIMGAYILIKEFFK